MLPAALQRDILRELVTVAPLLAAFDRVFVKSAARSDKITLRALVDEVAGEMGKAPPSRFTADGQKFFRSVRRVLAHRQFELHYPHRTTWVYGIKRVNG